MCRVDYESAVIIAILDRSRPIRYTDMMSSSVTLPLIYYFEDLATRRARATIVLEILFFERPFSSAQNYSKGLKV